ncbi:FAD-binding oxidoreductase [Aquabacter spiritensis]|uniref:FAD/FMN-containing dehydrogenase n=1 Tax=Aquabacter spiritensis TaxID=933073 RepID=A0A4R3LQZ9_9HYPH|nr:FAD-binding oxidoreductase [Aquabacter spiritensis]TCT02039.1 FAD/FMN-containing dehydrogenase [Aquabacter spiritensis]
MSPSVDARRDALRDAFPRPGLIRDGQDERQAAGTDYRRWFSGPVLAVARPNTVAEVQALAAFCTANGIAMVPQGGNTSLCGAAIPAGDRAPALVLSLGGLNAIRSVTPSDWSLVAEAGATLTAVQEAARAHERHFGLDIGARGSAQVGGLIATNAGGVNVLRYGSCRDLVLGLEVVLPDGRLWPGLKALRKDNSGYDLKHLFIGSEGTLGIITAATLRLHPLERESGSALLAMASLEACTAIAEEVLVAGGGRICALELMPRMGIEQACTHVVRCRPPMALEADWYLLVRMAGADPVDEALEVLAARAVQDGWALDAVLTRSKAQEEELWAIRDAFSDVHRHLGLSFRFDLSVPLAHVGELYTRLCAAIMPLAPGFVPFGFGHLGDGNLHFSACQPPGMAAAELAMRRGAIEEAVNAVVWALGGSISAEHGIGQLHRAELVHQKSAVELELMRALKSTLDPAGLLNPGKILV